MNHMMQFFALTVAFLMLTNSVLFLLYVCISVSEVNYVLLQRK